MAEAITIDQMASSTFEPKVESAAISELRFVHKANEVIDLINQIETVEKIKPRIAGDSYIYKFHISDKILIITSDRMNNATMFSRRYLEEFDELPPKSINKAEVWALFIKAINELGKLQKLETDVEDDDVYEAECFLNQIRNLPVTTDRKLFRKNHNKLFQDSGELFLPADRVKDIKKISCPKISHIRLLELIKQYHTKKTKIRYGDGSLGQVWCWVFSDKLVKDEVISLSQNPIVLPSETDISGGF